MCRMFTSSPICPKSLELKNEAGALSQSLIREQCWLCSPWPREWASEGEVSEKTLYLGIVGRQHGALPPPGALSGQGVWMIRETGVAVAMQEDP